MEANTVNENTTVIVIAKGKIDDCVKRAQDGIKVNKQVVVLGKSHTINKAISITEIIKRQDEDLK